MSMTKLQELWTSTARKRVNFSKDGGILRMYLPVQSSVKPNIKVKITKEQFKFRNLHLNKK